MQLLSNIFRICDINFQPTNSERINIDSAKTRLYPGAHIATANPYEYFHHGIVVDLTGDMSIVHFWGHKKREALVQTTTLPIFIAGNVNRVGIRNRQLYLVNYEDDTVMKQQETCERAKEMLNRPNSYKFHLMKLNCESFANFCRTQEWKSEQATILKSFPAAKIRRISRRIAGTKKRNVYDFILLITPVSVDVSALVDKAELRQLCQQYALPV